MSTAVTEFSQPTEEGFQEWMDLDITIAESGPALDTLIQLTGNGCGATCQSACTSCK